MLRWAMQLLRMGARKKRHTADNLESVDRDLVRFMFTTLHGIPQPDWGAAEMWLARQPGPESQRPNLKRAIAAAWLDEVRDALTIDHRRWRHAQVEGLGPLEDRGAVIVAEAADRSIGIIEKALLPIRGQSPMPPIAVIGLRSLDDYYSFIAREFSEGDHATSGGVYLNTGPECFPVLVFPMPRAGDPESVIAHELTHHALHGYGLPLWVEEGITQMMEERVTGASHFRLNQEMADRHTEFWDEAGFERLLSGESFGSPHEDEQELAYHLSQWAVRGMLSSQSARFFAFARACADQDPEHAMHEHLGMGQADILRRGLRI